VDSPASVRTPDPAATLRLRTITPRAVHVHDRIPWIGDLMILPGISGLTYVGFKAAENQS
jgi:hypothetical protein